MAKPKQRQAQIEFQGYIEVRLDEEQKKEFADWLKKNPDVDAVVDKCAESGYRMSMAYDDYNSAFMCSLTTKDAQSTNAGWVLVGRGKTCSRALLQVLFKHLIVTQEQWVNFRQSSRDDWSD